MSTSFLIVRFFLNQFLTEIGRTREMNQGVRGAHQKWYLFPTHYTTVMELQLSIQAYNDNRSANGIFGIVGRIASEEVVLCKVVFVHLL